jgi:hypothetical protein
MHKSSKETDHVTLASSSRTVLVKQTLGELEVWGLGGWMEGLEAYLDPVNIISPKQVPLCMYFVGCAGSRDMASGQGSDLLVYM